MEPALHCSANVIEAWALGGLDTLDAALIRLKKAWAMKMPTKPFVIANRQQAEHGLARGCAALRLPMLRPPPTLASVELNEDGF
jgi:hypothetical protein